MGEIDVGPAKLLGKALEEDFFGDASFAGKESQERLGGTVLDGDAPGFAPLGELLGINEAGFGQNVFDMLNAVF